MPAVGDSQLQTLITTLQNVVVALGNMTKQLNTTTTALFPQINTTSTSATAGTHGAVPAQVAGYIQTTLPQNLGGGTVKIPYFNV